MTAYAGCHKHCFGASSCAVGWADGSCGRLPPGNGRPPMFKPMTDEEAERAYDEAPAIPLSEERIKEIVAYATGPCPDCADRYWVCCCGKPLNGSHDHNSCGPSEPCSTCNRRGYGVCPECGVHCWLDMPSGGEPNFVELKNRHPTETDYGPGEDWAEVWKCPACGKIFEENNGYP